MKTSEIIGAELKARGYCVHEEMIDDFDYGEVCSFIIGYVRLEVYDEEPRMLISDESGSLLCHQYNLTDPNSIEDMFKALDECIDQNCTDCPNRASYQNQELSSKPV